MQQNTVQFIIKRNSDPCNDIDKTLALYAESHEPIRKKEQYLYEIPMVVRVIESE